MCEEQCANRIEHRTEESHRKTGVYCVVANQMFDVEGSGMVVARLVGGDEERGRCGVGSGSSRW